MFTIIPHIFLSSCVKIQEEQLAQNRNRSFNDTWMFFRGDTSGAQLPEFDDSQWRILDLPHDWSIEDLPGEQSDKQVGPFSKDSPGGTSTGFTIGGTGWYRKHFTLDKTDSAKSVILHFDGIYMESDVWINGQHVGFHAYGYTPFYYDISPYLNPAGERNNISIRVKNNGKNSRWYSGSGIYRNVWLTVVEPVHIDVWGVYITTSEITDTTAKINLAVSIKNELANVYKGIAKIKIIDSDDKVVGMTQETFTVGAKNITRMEQTVDIAQPIRWSPENPYLYKAEITVIALGRLKDIYCVNFGIRTIDDSAEKGFRLNGKSILLKGGCLHHDNGLLGSAAYNRAEERKVELLKSYGFNTVRTAHNPPSESFLNACDRLGIMVIDESFDMWERPKNKQDYHRYFKEWWHKDLQAMLLRDRNHPSIIMWSIGNEVNERADSSGIRIARDLIKTVRALDTTRPVTNAICGFWDHPGKPWEDTTPAFDLLDISGYNYQWHRYSNDHEQYPNRLIYGSESITREAWENWCLVEKYPYIIGDFVWTAMDYLGETGIGHAVYRSNDEKDLFAMPWPWYNAWCGDIDICGNKKPQSYYRDIVWGRSKLELLVHTPVPKGKTEMVSYWGWPDEYPSWNWTGSEGDPLQVSAYTTCSKVRLDLNGKVIGEKTMEADSGITVTFKVPYEPGILKCSGFIDGKKVVTQLLKTSGPPAGIRINPDRHTIRADRNDLAYIAIEIIDAEGNLVPDAALPVHLNLTGEGELLATGNAAPDQMASFKQPQCITYRGRSLVILRPTSTPGTISITAEAQGLRPASITITTK
jgi:beta-galactosidase